MSDIPGEVFFIGNVAEDAEDPQTDLEHSGGEVRCFFRENQGRIDGEGLQQTN